MKDTKVRNVVLIVISLIVLFPIVRYIDNLPTAKELKRQKEQEKEDREEQKQKEAMERENEEEKRKEAENELKWEKVRKIEEEEREKERKIEALSNKIYTFFSGCKWKIVNISRDGKIHLECYSSYDYWGDTEITFNITQAEFRIGQDDKQLYVSLGEEIIAVCPGGDHTVFLEVLKRFKEAVKAKLLEE